MIGCFDCLITGVHLRPTVWSTPVYDYNSTEYIVKNKAAKYTNLIWGNCSGSNWKLKLFSALLTKPFYVTSEVNYVKAIDKYLIVSFLFVFCSLVEYAIVLLLDRGKRKFELRKKEVGNFTDKVKPRKEHNSDELNASRDRPNQSNNIAQSKHSKESWKFGKT